MTTNNQSNEQAGNQSSATVVERANGLKERAGVLLQDGIEAVKANPAATAAVIGGVAAAAAAFVNRDKIVETAGTLRDKASGKSEYKA
jgi:hypothetical protein